MGSVKSSKPKKQRKYFHSRPLHKKQAGLAGHLSKKLRQQLGKRSMSLRKSDTVKVMRGSRKGHEGKIVEVSYRKGTVSIEKLIRKKADGTEIPLPIKASKVIITEIDRSDARRFKGKAKKALLDAAKEPESGTKAFKKPEGKGETGKHGKKGAGKELEKKQKK
ncbi:MAG: 50S ribosomal protein L24 [Candidatus Diapherotrites archaeon]|uniref:Large ribosomal subunit protein uL24 n=1 Tax=Candidatus Iainarchaeum sp. TaxID=3101447 RepID=A0A938YQA9_9ARCH|nr:50S ribosomal protein L24 [Candidatus Diapherotrites archaeon]